MPTWIIGLAAATMTDLFFTATGLSAKKGINSSEVVEEDSWTYEGGNINIPYVSVGKALTTLCPPTKGLNGKFLSPVDV